MTPNPFIKQYLMTAGPTPVPPAVSQAMAAPMLYHRAPAFDAVYERVLAKLPKVFQTQNDVLTFASSGSGAMDSAAANLVRPGTPALACAAGKFGERWIELCEAYGADLVKHEPGWGVRFDAAEVERLLDEHPGVEVVFATLSETSTGIVHDVRALADVARRLDALLVVDAVSGLGATRLEQDAWGIDVVVSGSQKALMTPPGLSLATSSPAAREAASRSTSPRFLFDWERTLAAQQRLDPPVTPAVSIVRALNVALGLILEEGLETAFERHVRLGRACREGAKAMGLELFSPDEERSAVVTAIRVPDGVDGTRVVAALRERFGITIANGQGELKGKIFRIGHIGWFDVFDITTALAAVELVLADSGAEIERGVAVTRALEAWAEHTPV